MKLTKRLTLCLGTELNKISIFEEAGRRRYPRGRPCFIPLNDFGLAADEFLDQLNRDEIGRGRVMTDF